MDHNTISWQGPMPAIVTPFDDVIAGTGAIRRLDAITRTKQAQDAGCDGALILPPYFRQVDR